MKSLVEIMNAKTDSGTYAVSTRAGMGLATTTILGHVLGATKATQFADDAASLITSNEFLGELEKELGLPQNGETENEFVARAKASMFEMLKTKFK